MNAAEIVEKLRLMGKESYKKVLQNHGVKEPLFGVSIEEMKKFQKPIKKDYQLALDLFDTGIYDAMYLAGLIADDAKMTKKDLQKWVQKANCPMLSEYTVAWVAAESPHGWDLAMEWIDSPKESAASTGWSTLSSLVAIKDDAELDLAKVKSLVERVQKSVHEQTNRVRYVMMGFIISVGSYIKSLTTFAIQTAMKIGPVSVNVGNTACKVPNPVEYIEKVKKRGSIGKKRKTAKC